VVNFTTDACRISSRLKWYKNYKNRLRLAKVMVKNKVSRFLWFTVYKIFGTMAIKDSYGQISEYFGIPSVEQLITNRHNRFLNRYRCQENYLCQALA